MFKSLKRKQTDLLALEKRILAEQADLLELQKQMKKERLELEKIIIDAELSLAACGITKKDLDRIKAKQRLHVVK